MKEKSSKSFVIFLIICFVILIALPLIGSQPLDYSKLIADKHSLDAEIFYNIRLPRVFFAFLIGASLSLVGSVFQALLRNDLATPYTLGVSSGGAFGAVVALKFNLGVTLFFFTSVAIFFFAINSCAFLTTLHPGPQDA